MDALHGRGHAAAGSFQAEYDGRLNKRDEAERAELTSELDAAFFHLYGIDRATGVIFSCCTRLS